MKDHSKYRRSDGSGALNHHQTLCTDANRSPSSSQKCIGCCRDVPGMAGMLSEWCISRLRRLRFFLWQITQRRTKVRSMAAIAHIQDMRNFSRGGSSDLPVGEKKKLMKENPSCHVNLYYYLLIWY